MQSHFNNITAHGITYCGEETPPNDLFWIDPKGHHNFWCSVTGGASGTSSSPRTEYRETEEHTSASLNWLPGDHPVNKMTGIVRLEKLPSSEKVIVAQVHAHKAPAPFIKIVSMPGEYARVEIRVLPTDDRSIIALRQNGLRHEYSIEIYDNSKLIIRLDDAVYESTVNDAWLAYPFYFKAGAYVIDTDGPAEEGGWVVYEKLSVYHGSI